MPPILPRISTGSRSIWGRVPGPTTAATRKALLALQGPEAETILQRLSAAPLGALPYYHALVTQVDGHAALVSRTGYTGEDGFEVLVDGRHTPSALWQAIMEAGQAYGLLPVGLGARDTLRLEARYLLYGQDMDEIAEAERKAGRSPVLNARRRSRSAP